MNLVKEASPLREASVTYYRQAPCEVITDKSLKIYLYTCQGPTGSNTIQHVYCYRHIDLIKLLDHWNYLGSNRGGWHYAELPEVTHVP